MTGISNEARQTIIRQIGGWNLTAISGGRWTPIRYGVDLPVAHGWHVQVELDDDDTYVVSRVFIGTPAASKRTCRAGIYAEQLREVVFRASCYRESF